MKILVTGGLGGVGRHVVKRLLAHGHAVRVLDRVADKPIDGAECVAGDLTAFEAVREQVRGMDAVIHLAALTHPAAGAGHEIFDINVTGTYHVYEAAAKEGIRRVVSASSINALGYNFGVHSFPIGYFPLNEAHPSHTTDVYSFSKQIVEEIAAYYWRRDGISGTQLRLPFVYVDSNPFGARFAKFFDDVRVAFRDLLTRPEAEQRDIVRQVIAKRDQDRAARASETPWESRPNRMQSSDKIDPVMALGMGYADFWSAISGDDAAQAFEKSVTADYAGSHPLYVGEAENTLGLPSAKLAGLFFPDSEIRRPLIGSESLVDYSKARALIGFEAAGSFGSWKPE